MQRLRVLELTAAPRQLPALQRLSWPSRLWRLLRPTRTHKESAGSLGLLGRLATAPQVSMSTVMLLIVLVGLWSLPQLTGRRGSRFDDVAPPLAAVSRAATAGEPDASARALTSGSHDETSTHAASADHAFPSPMAAGAEPDPAENARRHKSDLTAGLAHYRAREYALAAPLFSRALISASSGAEEAMTLLYLARAERALGHCERAVNSYATLVRVHPAKAEALAALREGMGCYDQLAEPGQAQRLLEQATSTPELATGARSLLLQRASAGRRGGGK